VKPNIDKIHPEKVQDTLVEFLPEFQQAYTGTKAYTALCDAVFDYINSIHVNREEKLQLVAHYRGLFEHLTLTTPAPSPKIFTWDREFQRHRAVT
jgi:hypothetical protein